MTLLFKTKDQGGNLFANKSFALNNPHVIDFALRNRGFSSLRLQGFVCLWLKPCNFGSGHEAPSPP